MLAYILNHLPGKALGSNGLNTNRVWQLASSKLKRVMSSPISLALQSRECTSNRVCFWDSPPARISSWSQEWSMLVSGGKTPFGDISLSPGSSGKCHHHHTTFEHREMSDNPLIRLTQLVTARFIHSLLIQSPAHDHMSVTSCCATPLHPCISCAFGPTEAQRRTFLCRVKSQPGPGQHRPSFR